MGKKICFLCNEVIGSGNHCHSKKSVPEKDYRFLCSLYKKEILMNVKNVEDLRMCCRHFNPHDGMFRFTKQNFPGIRKIEVFVFVVFVFVVCCLLFVVCCLLFVVCCLLFVVCLT
jgi:hypothetical protein